MEIAAAIRTANMHRLADVLIVARGGGSIEDLWAFNEEAVAAAVFGSALPIVSGVGHETDFTICDFVADLRAPTPTAAASAVTPDRVAVADRVTGVARRFIRAGRHQRDVRMQRLDSAARCLVHPAARIAAQRERLADFARRLAQRWHATAMPRHACVSTLHARLAREMRAPLPAAQTVRGLGISMQRLGRERIAHASRHLDRLAQNLAHLNPQAVLERGYAIVATAEGTIVQDAAQVAPGDAVTMTFAHGGAAATVTRRTP
jgi:exodeoxyribonuclease VII large subunit